MYLDQSHHVLKVECISNGGTTNVIADPRIIFKNALNHRCHLHRLGAQPPFGQPTPQRGRPSADQKFVSAGKLLDITVIDHIIIGNERYHSFRDYGEMTF